MMEEECDLVMVMEEIMMMRDKISGFEKIKVKGVVMFWIFLKFWIGKDRDGVGDVSSLDMFGSFGLVIIVDDKLMLLICWRRLLF